MPNVATIDQKESRRKAYTSATARLRDENKALFEAILAEEYAKVGIEYKRRKTAAERAQEKTEAKRVKAEQTLAALLREYPDLLAGEQ